MIYIILHKYNKCKSSRTESKIISYILKSILIISNINYITFKESVINRGYKYSLSRIISMANP